MTDADFHTHGASTSFGCRKYRDAREDAIVNASLVFAAWVINVALQIHVQWPRPENSEAYPYPMEQPGLDGRHRDKDGEIDQKHGNTLNKHLSPPIPQFSPETTLQEMRDKTGKVSETDVREAAKRL